MHFSCMAFTLPIPWIFISSGIIDMKEQAVREALEANEAFEILEVTRQGEWVSFTARKK